MKVRKWVERNENLAGVCVYIAILVSAADIVEEGSIAQLRLRQLNRLVRGQEDDCKTQLTGFSLAVCEHKRVSLGAAVGGNPHGLASRHRVAGASRRNANDGKDTRLMERELAQRTHVLLSLVGAA
eukprot:3465237-Pleurochrysis_carterae.AAC.4